MHHSLSELLAEFRAAIDTDDPQHYCDVCGAPVRAMRERCPDCRALRARQDRALQLGCAYSSLPDMPWAVVGPELAAKCNAAIFSTACRWTRSKSNLVLVGPSGCGKTSAVVARVRAILDHALQGVDRASFDFAAGIRFATAADLALARKRWPLGDGEAPDVEEALGASLLVLDELGYEPQADTAIPEIVDARYRRGKLTISTSGQTLPGLVERYGDATVRKLVGTGSIVEAFEVAR